MREDPALTEAIRRGDPAAIGQVVHAALPGLVRAGLAAGLSLDKAEDSAQDAVLVFVRRAAEFDGRAKATTWLHGMMVRTIMAARRNTIKDDRHHPIDEVMEAQFRPDGRWAAPLGDPIGDLARGEVRQVLEGCLDSLSNRYRLAFTLREVEGIGTADLCKILETNANNLGVLLYRARNQLRECLEAHSIEGSEDARM